MSRGFTLIELLVVISIIAILSGMLLVGIGMVRRQAAKAEAIDTISQITVAVNQYQQEGYRLFPRQPKRTGATIPDADESSIEKLTVGSDISKSNGMISVLMSRNLYAPRLERLRTGVLLDPWGGSYYYALGQSNDNYSLQSSLSTSGLSASTTNLPANWSKPPYIWSLGPTPSTSDATGWIANVPR